MKRMDLAYKLSKDALSEKKGTSLKLREVR